MKTKQETITIEEACDEIMLAAEEALTKIAASGRQIILGLMSAQLTNSLGRISQNFELANSILELYTSFFKGKKKSFELFANEIIPFLKLSSEETDMKIRLAFIEFNNIKIPNFERMKKSKIVDFIEYDDNEQRFFDHFEKYLADLRATKFDKYVEEFFDKKTLQFKITKELEEQLIASHTKKASIDQASNFIAISFVAQGLDQLLENRGHAYDTAYQSQVIYTLLMSFRDKLQLTDRGISVNIPVMKKRYGFDESLSKIRISFKKKSAFDSDSAEDIKESESPTSAVDVSALGEHSDEDLHVLID